MVTIAGYIIVRNPEQNEVSPARSLEKFTGLTYHGIDRMMWYDIDTCILEGKVPNDLKLQYQQLRASDNDFTFTSVLQSIEVAQRFLSVTEDVIKRNEIVALSSAALTRIKGEIAAPSDSIEWLGYDLVLLGGWSLIKHGVFENREIGLVREKQLNEYGLFDDVEGLDSFLAEYERLASTDKIDQLLAKEVILDFVHVGRMKKR